MNWTVVFPLSLLLICLSAAQQPGDIIVAKDGSGHHSTVQAAINSAPDSSQSPVRIYIKAGTYKEKILVPATKTNIHFIGEHKDRVILTYDDYAGKPIPGGGEIGTSTSYSVKVQGADFYANSVTFENSAGTISQAVALMPTGDRARFTNCNIIANQDTLYPTTEGGRPTRQYYNNCLIQGTTDFIFGAATALFENCEIRSKFNSYITAASTPEGTPYGFVFRNCRLTATSGVTSVYLGRPWRPYARTVFLNTSMQSHINPAGWHNWNDPNNERTAFYAEYGTTGVPVNQRVPWSRQLSASEAAGYTNQNVLSGWNPSP